VKNSIFSFLGMIAALMALTANLACNNTTRHNANASDSLTKDSANVRGKDNTAIPLDSGTSASTSALDTAGKIFINKAASGGMLEVELGNLSAQNGASPRVKQFGQMMVKEHAEVNSNLKNIADQFKVALPDSMLPEHAHHKMELSKTRGKAFDKAYMKMMVEDHRADIAEFEKAAKSNSAMIKNFALQTLPLLQKHLDSANAIIKGKL